MIFAFRWSIAIRWSITQMISISTRLHMTFQGEGHYAMSVHLMDAPGVGAPRAQPRIAPGQPPCLFTGSPPCTAPTLHAGKRLILDNPIHILNRRVLRCRHRQAGSSSGALSLLIRVSHKPFLEGYGELQLHQPKLFFNASFSCHGHNLKSLPSQSHDPPAFKADRQRQTDVHTVGSIRVQVWRLELTGLPKA